MSQPDVHRTAIQMRFADTDALGHVNNGSFALYAETARLEFLARLGSAARSLILAHLAIDFRKQVMFGQGIEVETAVERIGTSSVTMHQRILADGERAADVRSVVVFFDYATQRAQPWTDEIRAALSPFVEAEEA